MVVNNVFTFTSRGHFIVKDGKGEEVLLLRAKKTTKYQNLPIRKIFFSSSVQLSALKQSPVSFQTRGDQSGSFHSLTSF